MKKEINPKLTVVGAGPGDPELLTIKAINALSEADVVLYDALANKILLKYAPIESEKIYVGKRNNKHSYTQEQINNLIVEKALTKGRVVRLKGGDPFVFGRGKEELVYAEAFNIETAIVPGISSATGVPALSGIPVTHRGLSESFWVVTATTRTGELSRDIYLAAKSKATIVVLMGLSKLGEISKVYHKFKKQGTPVAVIENGTLPNEKIAIGDFTNIELLVKEERIKSPAIIIIGNVVQLHPYYELLTDKKYFSLN
ncbi:MAG: uroporphyrinogen-III C-methyltransferase [Bacteroidia bacterium]